MASAEQLLNEAQYAFQCITAGDSGQNRRHAARAKSLCRKIFRKYPGTSEAVVAHGIMMRLGEPAPVPQVVASHESDPLVTVTEVTAQEANDATVALDWAGLLAVIFGTSKAVLGVIGFVLLMLFGFLGPLLFLPLLVILFVTRPFMHTMKPEQRRQMNAAITRLNAWIEQRRRSRRGLV